LAGEGRIAKFALLQPFNPRLEAFDDALELYELFVDGAHIRDSTCPERRIGTNPGIGRGQGNRRKYRIAGGRDPFGVACL